MPPSCVGEIGQQEELLQRKDGQVLEQADQGSGGVNFPHP